jgi:hypothetical protein
MRTFTIYSDHKEIGKGCEFDTGRIAVERSDVNALGFYASSEEFYALYESLDADIVFDNVLKVNGLDNFEQQNVKKYIEACMYMKIDPKKICCS